MLGSLIMNSTIQNKTNRTEQDGAGGSMDARGNKSAVNSGVASEIPNIAAIKAAAKVTWELGGFGKIAESVEEFARDFRGELPLKPGNHLLDVAFAQTAVGKGLPTFLGIRDADFSRFAHGRVARARLNSAGHLFNCLNA